MKYRYRVLILVILGPIILTLLPSVVISGVCKPDMDRYICDAVEKMLAVSDNLSTEQNYEYHSLINIGKVYRSKQPDIFCRA